MICVECINRRPKEGYRKSNIHLDAKEERRASYEKIYFIIYYDAFISFIMEWGRKGVMLWQGSELRFIKVPVIRNEEKMKAICIEGLTR